MNQYHKINTIFKRDPNNKNCLIEGEYSCEEFKYLAYNCWVFTEKVDGTNIRIMYDNLRVTFGGKTDNASIPARLVERLQDLFPDASKFVETFKCDGGVCLYGEGYGGYIQKGSKYIASPDFVLFDVKIGNWWLKRKDVEEIAQKMGLDVVPIVGAGTLPEAVDITREGQKSIWGDFISEGIVVRPSIELFDRSGKRIIAKIKHRDFI